MAQRSLFLMLDIDNTLYEYAETGFGEEMHDLIYQYAETKLHLTREEASAISVKYYKNYGLSLRGYVEHYNVDPKDYSDFVHQCSYDRLHYNGPLVDMLTRLHYGSCETSEKAHVSAAAATLPAPHVHGQQDHVRHHLYFFTNANRPHARSVLTPLGLKPLFTRPRQPGSPATAAHKTYDEAGFEEATEWLGFSYEDQWRLTGEQRANKPMKAAYEAIYKAIDEEIALDEQALVHGEGAKDGIPSHADSPAHTPEAPSRSPTSAQDPVASPTRAFTAHKRAHLQPRNMVMVDDSLMNLDGPLELGWNAVWFAHDDLQLPTDGEQGALYAAAVAEGRLKVIRNVLELEKVVEELALLP